MKGTRWWLLLTATCALLAAPVPGTAQQTGKNARVGWVYFDSDPKGSPRASAIEGLRTGLRERGWIEGRNIVLDVRGGDLGDAAAIAKAFVDSKADVICADGVMFSRARPEAGTTPIVFTTSADPVAAKWVATLARPGGNVTGMTTLALDLEAKRLELLKEIKPGITRVAVLANERHPGYPSQIEAAQAAARQLGLVLQIVLVRTPGDFDTARGIITRGGAEGILMFHDSVLSALAKPLAAFAEQHRIPTIAPWHSYVEAGNVLSYGPNEGEFFRRVAGYIDRILRGARPADLPVELPTRFELTVNRKTASALGLTLPLSILLRAERVIE